MRLFQRLRWWLFGHQITVLWDASTSSWVAADLNDTRLPGEVFCLSYDPYIRREELEVAVATLISRGDLPSAPIRFIE
jgi:hypothetical protein